MTIQTTTCKCTISNVQGTYLNIEVPVAKVGDTVELADSQTGTVIDTVKRTGRICVAMAGALPGEFYATNITSVKKLWRGDDVWVSDE